jgi:hypothetical protein
MKENNNKQKIYTVWRREEVHYEYLVKANSREEAKVKVEECTYDLDGFGHLVNDYYEVWQDGESVYEIFEVEDDNANYREPNKESKV